MIYKIYHFSHFSNSENPYRTPYLSDIKTLTCFVHFLTKNPYRTLLQHGMLLQPLVEPAWTYIQPLLPEPLYVLSYAQFAVIQFRYSRIRQFLLNLLLQSGLLRDRHPLHQLRVYTERPLIRLRRHNCFRSLPTHIPDDRVYHLLVFRRAPKQPFLVLQHIYQETKAVIPHL